MTIERLRAALSAGLTFAARDLRVVLLDYKILIFSIAIGVAAVTGVGALTDSFLSSLASDGRALVGGDISFSRAQEPLSKEEQLFLTERGTVSTIANLRAMVSTDAGGSALAEIKAVEQNFPLVGAVETAPTVPAAALDVGGQFGALLDPALMARLGVTVGDAIRIGTARLAVRAKIESEPDRLVTGAGFAPRLILSREALAATGLVTPEALVRWTAKLALPSIGVQPANDTAVDGAVNAFRQTFPNSGFEIRTRSNASPQVTRITDRVTKFLILMGLLSVVVGGIGVWSAVALFVERQRVPVAIFKTLGASGSFVFGLALTEILVLAACGIVLGLLLGAALPFAFEPFLVRAGIGTFHAAVSPRALAGGAAVGFGAALVFSIIPAGGVHDVPGALLLRDAAGQGSSTRVRPRYIALACVSLVLFTLAISAVSGSFAYAVAIVAGALALAALFDGGARLFSRIVRRLPKPTDPVAALAWSGLARASRLSRAVVISLGVGLIVLAATSAVTASLRAQLTDGLPQAMPNVFLVGLPAKDDGAFRSFLDAKLPGATIDSAPLLRGRITEIGGVPAEKAAAKESTAWVLEGDRGITYASTPPRDSSLVAGTWWAHDYDGPPLVSLGADAARGLGLKVGDEIVVNVAGRKLSAKIANLREINWASFGINFVLVFSPRPIEAAPHTTLFTVAASGLDDPGRNAAFVKTLSENWPGVIAIDVHAMLAQARTLVDKVGLAIQACSLFTILATAVVLAGAVAADSRARSRTNTILKVLGGTRRQLVAAAMLEFAVLGLTAGLAAVIGGNLVAWALLRWAIDTPFVLALGPLATLLALAVSAIAIFGLIGNWRMLNEPPSRVLRRL